MFHLAVSDSHIFVYWTDAPGIYQYNFLDGRDNLIAPLSPSVKVEGIKIKDMIVTNQGDTIFLIATQTFLERPTFPGVIRTGQLFICGDYKKFGLSPSRIIKKSPNFDQINCEKPVKAVSVYGNRLALLYDDSSFKPPTDPVERRLIEVNSKLYDLLLSIQPLRGNIPTDYGSILPAGFTLKRTLTSITQSENRLRVMGCCPEEPNRIYELELDVNPQPPSAPKMPPAPHSLGYKKINTGWKQWGFNGIERRGVESWYQVFGSDHLWLRTNDNMYYYTRYPDRLGQTGIEEKNGLFCGNENYLFYIGSDGCLYYQRIVHEHPSALLDMKKPLFPAVNYHDKVLHKMEMVGHNLFILFSLTAASPPLVHIYSVKNIENIGLTQLQFLPSCQTTILKSKRESEA